MRASSYKLPGLLTVLLCAAAAASAQRPPAVNVNTVNYRDVAFYPEHRTAAEVIARHDSAVSAELSAVVVAVNRDTGDSVNAGDTVISLDCRSYQLQLQQAEAAYAAAVAQYDNAKKLFASARKLQQQNSIAQELYNQREADASRLKAEVAGAKAGIGTARLAVDKCDIKAPYDGYISARSISKGELVQPGTPVFQMITSEQGRVEAHINNFEYESFLQGTDHRFEFNGATYDLVVDSILPVLDKTWRTHTARLSFTGSPAPTGSHGSLTWRDSKRALPSRLVVIRDGQAGVLVANSSTAQFIPVDSYTEGHPAAVELEPDAQIITTGRHGLRHGDTVMVVPAN